MNAPANLSKVEQIRARDGEECWACGFPMDFSAPPGSKKAPTKEHLLAQSLGGTDELANLVLCHPGCNSHLGNKPVSKKREIRRKMRANRVKILAAQGSAGSKVLAEPINKTTGVPAAAPPAPRTGTDELRRWQWIAAANGAAALLAIGILLGLLVAG